MSFLYPIYLWFIIPLTFLLSKKRDIISNTHIVIMLLIILSLSRPVIEDGVVDKSIESANIIIAIDASYSMRANDISPNRYEFAKKTIELLLKDNPKIDVTLIAFTQNPLLLSPPTNDHKLINTALNTLNPKYILTKGTSLKNLFKKIATLNNPHKNLLLISDGGEESDTQGLKELLEEGNINLTILATGTQQGSTIKKDNGELLKDRDENLVISTLNPILKELTSNYIEVSSTPESTAQEIKNSINRYKKEIRDKKEHSYIELYQIPLFMALVLFFLLHTKYIKYLIILLSLIGISANASILDNYHLHQAYSSYKNGEYKKVQEYIKKIDTSSLESRMILANSYYKLEKYKRAIATYQSIESTSIKTKQKLYYNIANGYVGLKEYSKAKEFYIKALQLGEDRDSRDNLKLIFFKESEKEGKRAVQNPKAGGKKSNHQNQKDNMQKSKEGKSSSASGSSSSSSTTQSKHKLHNHKKIDKLIATKEEKQERVPLSSKVYDLINKGYIHETKPW